MRSHGPGGAEPGRGRLFPPPGHFGALPRIAARREPISRLDEGFIAHTDFDDVDS